jgi:hypothetical protein
MPHQIPASAASSASILAACFCNRSAFKRLLAATEDRRSRAKYSFSSRDLVALFGYPRGGVGTLSEVPRPLGVGGGAVLPHGLHALVAFAFGVGTNPARQAAEAAIVDALGVWVLVIRHRASGDRSGAARPPGGPSVANPGGCRYGSQFKPRHAEYRDVRCGTTVLVVATH